MAGSLFNGPGSFDPNRAHGAEAPPETGRGTNDADDSGSLTVSELSNLIKSTLESRLGSSMQVVGEISNLSQRNHWYFSLKDSNAVVGCVMWASSARRVKFAPADGDEVILSGHVSYYAPQGRTQFYVTAIRRVGAGELERRFQELCDQLREAGHFDESHKQPLPTFPRRIAVITSATSAAVQDVIATARQRLPAVGLVIVDVPVQGERAAPKIAAAIEYVDRYQQQLGVDAVLVTRGGGSIEDLWAFNELIVAKAVIACQLPVVAAIGHESDTTIIELVADRRAATPTQAVMQLIPAADALHQQVDHLGDRMHFVFGRFIQHRRQRLQTVEQHEMFRAPHRLIEHASTRLDQINHRLTQAVRHTIVNRRNVLERLTGRWLAQGTGQLVARHRDHLHQLEHRLDLATRAMLSQGQRRLEQGQARLDAIDPRRVLDRGFSYTTGRGGQVIRSKQDVSGGDRLITHVADGAIRSTVNSSPTPGATRGTKDKPSPDDEQMDLFDRSR